MQELYGDFPLSTALSAIFDDKIPGHSHRIQQQQHQHHQGGALFGMSMSSTAENMQLRRDAHHGASVDTTVVEYASIAECEAVLRICLRDSEFSDILAVDALASQLDDTADTSSSSSYTSSSSSSATAAGASAGFNRHRIVKSLCVLYEKCMGMSRAEAKAGYVAIVQGWKLFGAAYFMAEASEDHNHPFEIILAITPQALIVIDPETRSHLQQYDYMSVVSWGHSYNSFVLVTESKNGLNPDHKKYFKTEQGKDINDYISAYVRQFKSFRAGISTGQISQQQHHQSRGSEGSTDVSLSNAIEELRM